MAPVLYGKAPLDEPEPEENEDNEDAEDSEDSEDKQLLSGSVALKEPATPTSKNSRLARLVAALPVLIGAFTLGMGLGGHFPSYRLHPSLNTQAAASAPFLATKGSTTTPAPTTTKTTMTTTKHLPEACRRLSSRDRLRRLRMPPEENLNRTFHSFAEHEDSYYDRSLPLSALVPNGTNMDSPATLRGNYARARQGHSETWFQRPGVCAPSRHEEPECVLFPVFAMTAGGVPFKKCSISLQQYETAEANASQDNLASPNKSESFLLKWEEPYVQPWWKPQSMMHDVPRHMVMLKTTLARYPWMTHFIKMDLDAYPYFFWALPPLAQPPTGAAAKTGHVYFGQWKIMGVWPGPRKANVTGMHKLAGDCGGIPNGDGGFKAWGCKKPTEKKWGGGFVSVDYRAANDGWCNDWSMADKDPGCFNHKGALGICSGFMYGHVWSFSRSLAQAVVESRDPKIFTQVAQDFGHSDIRVGAWVNRVALGANESVELRAAAATCPGGTSASAGAPLRLSTPAAVLRIHS